MKPRRRFEMTLATLLFLALSIGTALAQSYPPAPDSAPTQDNPSQQTSNDPPGRVARIQYMSGQVSIQPGGVNDWVAANMNRPLTTSDRVWTDKDSKAELNVGGGYIRMNSETSLTLSSVSDNVVQLELDQGTLSLTVRHLEGGEIYEVDTPNTAFTVMKPGVYRFNVYPNEDQTWVTVRQGYGEATGRGNAVKVKAGEQVRFANSNSLQHTAEAAPAPDGFDDWAKVRDQRLDSSQSARYVSPGMVGYEDLDVYGTWRTIPPYGPVWVPSSVPVGWAPYRFGHWAWIPPWGWTWVDDAPWGFAPFHYGRWVNSGGYWGWAPGPYRYYRPCYAPALVAWVGGPGFGIGVGFGGAGWGVGINFGWFPLGWGEPFYPWYHGRHGYGLSPAYVRNVNITNTHITNITNITNNYYSNNITNTHYVNRTVAGAMTAAPRSAIVNGQAINRFGGAVPRADLGRAQVVRTVDASPTRAAMLGGQTPRSTSVPPSNAINRSVVTRSTPPQRSNVDARLNVPASVGAPNANSVRTPGASPVARGADAVHNVPRPPSTGIASPAQGAYSASQAQPGVATHNVPRPPERNGDAYARGTGSSPAATNANSNAAHPASEPRSVPRPPAASEVQHTPAAANQSGQPPHAPASVRESAPPARQSAPPAHSAPEGKPKSEKSNSASAVPRPPTNYTYHAAPAYVASAGNRSSVPSYGGGSSYGRTNSYAGGIYSSTPSYSTRPGSYAAAPSYGNRGPSYSSPPTYRAGNAAPTPSYAMRSSTPSAPHYSPPASYAKGSGSSSSVHYSAPSGSGSHVSHGGGGGHSR